MRRSGTPLLGREAGRHPGAVLTRPHLLRWLESLFGICGRAQLEDDGKTASSCNESGRSQLRV